MADLTLRLDKGSPLTNLEIDTNFSNLNDEIQTKLNAEDYNANDVLEKLKSVQGNGAGLDADFLGGRVADSANTSDTIVLRDSSGNFSAGTITAALLSGDILLQVGKTISFEGSTDNIFETTLSVVDPTEDRTLLLPNISGTLLTSSDTGTITNNMLAGNIANSKLVNSSITIDGVSVALGGSISILSANNNWIGIQTFTDDKFTLKDNVDSSKVVNFQLSNLTPGTTQTMVIPDETGILATRDFAQNYTQTYVQASNRNSQGSKTISSAVPSGGVSGDIWYRV